MSNFWQSSLDELEAEGIYILREVASQFERPLLLFSGGKDSICIVHLALKAFRPARFPFALLHVDTGHNFPETIEYRDQMISDIGETLHVRLVQDSINQGKAQEEKGPNASRNGLQTVTLLDALEELKCDAAIGGARRDEEKARAKERIFSHRDEFGQWDPQNQRPELWSLLNGMHRPGEHFRCFPLSNWTELDVWNYIERENIKLPKVYFSHEREVIRRKSGVIVAACDFNTPLEGDKVEKAVVRCRTVGDMTCTGMVESKASSVADIIEEIKKSETTERGLREDDKRSESAMEDRKKDGYF